MWRGHIDIGAKVYDLPVLTVKIDLSLMTNDVDQNGYYVSTKHTLASMKFFDVDDLKMEGFNHQNAIFVLNIEQKTREEGPTPYFQFDFDPSFGIDASFTCLRIEISEVVPCTVEGDPAP